MHAYSAHAGVFITKHACVFIMRHACVFTIIHNDVGALQLANCYNRNDCWTRAHLLAYAARYGTAVGYDEQLLTDLHGHKLFSAVPMITKLRSFLLVADDGKLQLGTAAPAPEVAYPGARNSSDSDENLPTPTKMFRLRRKSSSYAGATASSVYYTAEAVLREAANLCERSLRAALVGRLEAASWGVGSGEALLPTNVKTVRTVLLFVRPKESDDVFLQVPSYATYKNDKAGVALVSVSLISHCTLPH